MGSALLIHAKTTYRLQSLTGFLICYFFQEFDWLRRNRESWPEAAPRNAPVVAGACSYRANWAPLRKIIKSAITPFGLRSPKCAQQPCRSAEMQHGEDWQCRRWSYGFFSLGFFVPLILVAQPLPAASQPSSSVIALVTVPLSLTSTGPQGGPFSPPFFKYQLRATAGAVDYSIETPPWLKSNPSRGTADTRGVVVTLEIGAAAQIFQPGNYTPIIRFTNTTNGRGNASRSVRLIVRPSESELLGSDGGNLVDDNDPRNYLLTGPGGKRLLAR